MPQLSLYRPWAPEQGVPFDQLRREMDALFSRFGSPYGYPSGWRGAFPAVNLYENPDAYMLTAELPGVASGEIQVSLEGSTVILQGERRSLEVAAEENASVHRTERQGGSFRRAFELPAAIDADKVEALHRHGVLILRLPKTPEHQPRQITVQAS